MTKAGFALLEMLIALAILSVTAAVTVGRMSDLTRDQVRMREREAEAWRAEAVLIDTVFLRTEELNLRLGVRQREGFLVRIDRPEPHLFRIGIAAATAPAKELVVTVIYRSERG